MTARNVVFILAMIVWAAAIAVLGGVYLWRICVYPDMTEARALLTFWPVYLGAAAAMIGAAFVADYARRR